MHVLAIDLGTTSLKGAVLDLKRAQINHITRVPMPDRLANPEPLLHELDPAAIVQVVQRLITDLRTIQPDAQAMVMCTQMHGMLLLGSDGQPLTPIITWQDQRARLPRPGSHESCLDWVNQRITQEQCQQLGHEIRPGIPNVTLPWFDPGATQGARVVSLPDYVLSQLSGAEPVIERSLAAAFGLLDLRDHTWHQEVIETLGLQHLRFPKIVDCLAKPYTIDGLHCMAPIGDHQAALLGADLQPNELSINISTGSQVSALRPIFERGDFHTRPFFNNDYLVTYPDIPAGRSLKVLLGLVTELGANEDPWRQIQQAVDATPASDLELDLAFFQSSGQSTGHIAGIREDNLTIGHLFRATFQSMAETYYQQAQQLPGSFNRLVFSGGIAQKQPALRDLIAARFGLPSRVCEQPEDTLLGLLTLSKRLFE